jgi:serine/threonine-protein kinase RsbW
MQLYEKHQDSAIRTDARALVIETRLVVATKTGTINSVVKKLMAFLKRTCCPPEHEFAVETALREGLANAILHGNRNDPRKKVRLSCGCEVAGGIRIAIGDEGSGFDPSKLPDPTVGENLASGHGRGLFLIQKLMDEVHFENAGREIHMRKER